MSAQAVENKYSHHSRTAINPTAESSPTNTTTAEEPFEQIPRLAIPGGVEPTDDRTTRGTTSSEGMVGEGMVGDRLVDGSSSARRLGDHLATHSATIGGSAATDVLAGDGLTGDSLAHDDVARGNSTSHRLADHRATPGATIGGSAGNDATAGGGWADSSSMVDGVSDGAASGGTTGGAVSGGAGESAASDSGSVGDGAGRGDGVGRGVVGGGASSSGVSGGGSGRGEAVGGRAVGGQAVGGQAVGGQVSGGGVSGGGGLDEAVAVFLAVRPRLMAVAYRILGGGSEVEDVVQEIWVRWQRMDRREVANPQAMLVTMTARVAINVTCSARRRRETTVANWPPEQADPSEDPASRIEEQEAVEQAVQLLMERLTPRERAALILREAFDYPYVQLSEFLQLRAANTRQLVSRARRRLAGEYHTAAPRPSHPEPHPHFTQALLRAARTGDLRDVEQLLADNSPADRPGPWRRRVGRHSHAELARPQTGVHSNRITHQTWAMASTERVTIEAVLRSVCGRRPERLVPLTGGGMNETCRAELEGGSTVVVRIARHPAPWFVDESYLMAQARDAGVPTPEVLGVEHHEDDGEVLSFSVQEYVPGRSLAELVGEINRTELERVVTDAGEILARVHSVMPAAGRGHQHVLRVPDDQEVLRVARIVDARGGAVPADLVVRAADFLRQELTDQAAPPPSLVHGDFCPKNILVHRGNVVGLIDWEFAGLAPAAYDFAQWEVDAGEPLQDRLDLVRRGYARIADPDVGAGWTAVFATAWALEKLGWKNPAGPAQFQRCLDVIGRAIVR